MTENNQTIQYYLQRIEYYKQRSETCFWDYEDITDAYKIHDACMIAITLYQQELDKYFSKQ